MNIIPMTLLSTVSNLSNLRRRKLVSAAAVGLLIVMPLLILNGSGAQTNGLISGSIVNGTNEEPAADLEVTLSRFTAEGFQGEVTTISGSDGSYLFENLDTDPANVYAVSVDYKNVLYASGMLRFNTEISLLTEDVTVFDTTTNSENLRAQSKGLILSVISPEQGEAGLLDVSLLQLDGNLTLVPDDNGRTVEFPVPLNAREVTPLEGYDFGNATIEGATVYSTTPFRPGAETATLAYSIPYTGTTIRLKLDIAYSTEAVNILIQDTFDLGTISVEGIGIVDEGRSQIGDQQYRIWSAPPMVPGGTLNLTFRNVPESAISANTLSRFEPVLLSVLALFAAISITVLIVYRRKLYRPRPVVLSPVLASSIEERREMLIEELRAIETAHNENRIDDKEYQQYRTSILEQLRLISRQMRGIDDPVT